MYNERREVKLDKNMAGTRPYRSLGLSAPDVNATVFWRIMPCIRFHKMFPVIEDVKIRWLHYDLKISSLLPAVQPDVSLVPVLFFSMRPKQTLDALLGSAPS